MVNVGVHVSIPGALFQESPRKTREDRFKKIQDGSEIKSIVRQSSVWVHFPISEQQVRLDKQRWDDAVNSRDVGMLADLVDDKKEGAEGENPEQTGVTTTQL